MAYSPISLHAVPSDVVACLTGVELLQDIYQRAIAERYRFTAMVTPC